MSFTGVVIVDDGAGVVAFIENAGVNGAVCAVADVIVGGVELGATDVVTRNSGAVLVDSAFLVASTMHFLASLNFISTFPSSAFNNRSCVSIDSLSAAALALFAFFLDADLPEAAVVVAAAPEGGTVCWAVG